MAFRKKRMFNYSALRNAGIIKLKIYYNYSIIIVLQILHGTVEQVQFRNTANQFGHPSKHSFFQWHFKLWAASSVWR